MSPDGSGDAGVFKESLRGGCGLTCFIQAKKAGPKAFFAHIRTKNVYIEKVSFMTPAPKKLRRKLYENKKAYSDTFFIGFVYRDPADDGGLIGYFDS